LVQSKSGVWSFLSSVKLTIFLLALIALFAVIGTVIPQRDAAVEFSRQISPGLSSFLHKMQLFDLYHSIWFFLLTALLSLNLIVCSLERIPVAWRRFRQQPSPQDKAVFQDLPDEQILRIKQDQKVVSEIATGLMKSRFRTMQRFDAADGTILCGKKGGFANFGVYVVHFWD
jgi:cytochrome c biogenesis protein